MNNASPVFLLKAIIPFLFAFLFSGCGNEAYYEEFKIVEQEKWDMNDIKEFRFHIGDISAGYSLIYTIRNTTDYPYSNLYLFATMHLPDQTAVRDTIECLIADKYGNWLGKGFGKIRENRFLIKEMYNFPDSGNYLITIEQAMRDTVLHGITDVGLRIEKFSY